MTLRSKETSLYLRDPRNVNAVVRAGLTCIPSFPARRIPTSLYLLLEPSIRSVMPIGCAGGAQPIETESSLRLSLTVLSYTE
jgi:hypothetical protein